jgi:predicted HAD superfamily hydrolase
VDKENVAHIHNEELFSHKCERNYVVCRKIKGAGDNILNEISQAQKLNIACLHSYVESRTKMITIMMKMRYK